MQEKQRDIAKNCVAFHFTQATKFNLFLKIGISSMIVRYPENRRHASSQIIGRRFVVGTIGIGGDGHSESLPKIYL